MTMMFAVKEARTQLETRGIVYTLRPFKRKKTGKDAYNYFRGDIKRGEVNIVYEGNFEGIEQLLVQFVQESGFKSLEDWLKKAKDSRYLYRVKLL